MTDSDADRILETDFEVDGLMVDDGERLRVRVPEKVSEGVPMNVVVGVTLVKDVVFDGVRESDWLAVIVSEGVFIDDGERVTELLDVLLGEGVSVRESEIDFSLVVVLVGEGLFFVSDDTRDDVGVGVGGGVMVDDTEDVCDFVWDF